MIDYPTEQVPSGILGWHAFLAAIDAADPGDENEWVEFKAGVDPRSKEGRAALAKAIVAFANRDPDHAAQWFGGTAFVLVGLEPGNAVGVEADCDPAQIHPAVSALLEPPAPAWDMNFVTYKERRVLIVTIAPPRQGDPIACIRKSTGSIDDGHIFVRRPGLSDRAKAHDIRRLSLRLQVGAETPGLDLELAVAEGDAVPGLAYADGWVDNWLTAEEQRLLAPLNTPLEEKIGTIIRDELLGFKRLHAASVAESSLFRDVPEDRTEEQYRQQVGEYLGRCHDVLTTSTDRIRNAHAVPFVFALTNTSTRNYEDVLVKAYIAGPVHAYEDGVRMPPVRKLVPKAPRMWGPWQESVLGSLQPDMSRFSVQLPPRIDLPGPTGPQITNGGSTTIEFPTVSLRPNDRFEFDPIGLVTDPWTGEMLTCTWSATATNVDGVRTGTMGLETTSAPLDLSEALAYRKNALGRD